MSTPMEIAEQKPMVEDPIPLPNASMEVSYQNPIEAATIPVQIAVAEPVATPNPPPCLHENKFLVSGTSILLPFDSGFQL